MNKEQLLEDIKAIEYFIAEDEMIVQTIRQHAIDIKWKEELYIMAHNHLIDIIKIRMNNYKERLYKAKDQLYETTN